MQVQPPRHEKHFVKCIYEDGGERKKEQHDGVVLFDGESPVRGHGGKEGGCGFLDGNEFGLNREQWDTLAMRQLLHNNSPHVRIIISGATASSIDHSIKRDMNYHWTGHEPLDPIARPAPRAARPTRTRSREHGAGPAVLSYAIPTTTVPRWHFSEQIPCFQLFTKYQQAYTAA